MLLLAPIRLAFKLFGLLVAAVVLYFAVTTVQIWLTSRHYDPRRAGAIVVMGAAQYNGVPSPDLAARLNQALALYRQGQAPVVAVTGSKEKGDRFTEAQAGARYLEAHGVPASAIVEAGGSDSWQNLSDVAPSLAGRGVRTVLMVTDPFHEYRSMAIASDVGFQPFPAPTRTSPIRGWSTASDFAREALAVGLGRIVGYHVLSELGWVRGLFK